MILSEKIKALRNLYQYSQENLAELCDVSRQTVSKWEAGTASPEKDKIVLLSRLFQVSTDVLLKEELTLNGVKENHSCSINIVGGRSAAMYEGILIKESLEDENVMDYLQINKVELWKTQGIPKYWTVLYFSSNESSLPQRFSQALIPGDAENGSWFVDFKAGNVKYIVFREKVLHYTIGNAEEKAAVCEACRGMGIPDEQMQWPE